MGLGVSSFKISGHTTHHTRNQTPKPVSSVWFRILGSEFMVARDTTSPTLLIHEGGLWG